MDTVTSLRWSSSVWRAGSTSGDVFSRSARDENDEEALKWAALEKLPTYDRIKKGILMGSKGEHREVEVENLGTLELKNLMERLVRMAEEDNERFLLKLKNRLDRCCKSYQEYPDIDIYMKATSLEGQDTVITYYILKVYQWQIDLSFEHKVISLSKISSLEKKELAVRLRAQLEQIQAFQKRLNSRAVTSASGVSVSSSSNGHGRKRDPMGQNGAHSKHGVSGRFESVKLAQPPLVSVSNSYAFC